MSKGYVHLISLMVTMTKVVTVTVLEVRKLKPRLLKQFVSGYMAMGGVELGFQARSFMLLGLCHLLCFGLLQVLQR